MPPRTKLLYRRAPADYQRPARGHSAALEPGRRAQYIRKHQVLIAGPVLSGGERSLLPGAEAPGGYSPYESPYSESACPQDHL